MTTSKEVIRRLTRSRSRAGRPATPSAAETAKVSRQRGRTRPNRSRAVEGVRLPASERPLLLALFLAEVLVEHVGRGLVTLQRLQPELLPEFGRDALDRRGHLARLPLQHLGLLGEVAGRPVTAGLQLEFRLLLGADRELRD